jgi:hypothetical protein
MGYTTDFTGTFTLDRPLEPEHHAYLKAFNETRRMERNSEKAAQLPDPRRIAANLPIGTDGEFFVGGVGFMGQDNDQSIVDYNHPPRTQPGLWCQWVPSDDGTEIQWDQGEKFYGYVEWLGYLVDNFLTPWGYKLNGTVEWQGEDNVDFGQIVVVDSCAKVRKGHRAYEPVPESWEQAARDAGWTPPKGKR